MTIPYTRADSAERGTTRRRFLRGTAASVGCLSLGALGGCAIAEGNEGPAYASWLPALDAVYADETGETEGTATTPSPSTEYLPFRAYTFDGIADYEAETGRTHVHRTIQDGAVHSVLPVQPEEVAFKVRSDFGFQVTETELGQEEIAETFVSEQDELDREPTDGGTVRIRNASESWVVAVDGGRVVETWDASPLPRSLHSPAQIIEDLIATGEGRRDGLVETDDAIAALVDHLGDATAVRGSTHERATESTPGTELFRGQVAWAKALTVDGSTTRLKWAFVFDPDAEIPVEAIEAYADADREPTPGRGETRTDTSVEVDGRAAVVEARTDTESALEWQTPT